jgi:acyl carrier protein
MNVRQQLQQVMRELFDDDDLEIRDDLTAAEVPEWDSLAHVRLIVAVEKEFGVRFSSGEVGEIGTVGELVRLVEGKLAG